MIIMQGADNIVWLAIEGALTLLFIVATWYMVIAGRDRSQSQSRARHSVVSIYGDLREEHTPVPKFLVYTYVGTAVWSIAYLFWTGINGFIH